MKRGFTLIELLVVVLIIGILAAVALPQYQRAVLKSRWAAIMPIVDGLKKAHEMYYLANGYYEADTSKLDINHPCTGTDFLICSNGFMLDNLRGSGQITDPSKAQLILLYCPGETNTSVCSSNYSIAYTVYLDHSDNAEHGAYCVGGDEQGRAFCKNLCGANKCYIK